MKTTTWATRMRRLAVTTGALWLAGSAGVSLAADEDEDRSGFHMMAIADRAAGELVTSGRFAEAIERITARGFSSGFDAQNNLCVAYTKTGKLERARVACDAAIEERRTDRAAVAGYSAATRGERRDRAIALSNRGVLRVVLGDLDGAREDFEKSAELDGRLDEPAANLARLAFPRTAALKHARAQ